MAQKEKQYDGWLVSNNLIKRSFAVLGHYYLASLIIVVPIFIIAILVGVMVGVSTIIP